MSLSVSIATTPCLGVLGSLQCVGQTFSPIGLARAGSTGGATAPKTEASCWHVHGLLRELDAGGWLQAALLYTAILENLAKAERLHRQERLCSWSSWAQEAVKGGASAAHTWSKGGVAPVEPVQNGRVLLDFVQQQWQEVWQVHAGKTLIAPTGDR
eukprot:171794-Amphidinium_carterae.1